MSGGGHIIGADTVGTHRAVQLHVFRPCVGHGGHDGRPPAGRPGRNGLLLTVKWYMAAILGGLGSPFAAAAGGLAIGLMEAFMAGYGTSLCAEPAVFVLILLVLIVRPYGLLGDYEAERR